MHTSDRLLSVRTYGIPCSILEGYRQWDDTHNITIFFVKYLILYTSLAIENLGVCTGIILFLPTMIWFLSPYQKWARFHVAHSSFIIDLFCRRGPLPRSDLLRQLPEIILAERVVEVAEAAEHVLAPLVRILHALESTHVVLRIYAEKARIPKRVLLLMFRSSYQNVVLLPPLGKVDLVFDVVAVADVDEGEILQHQSHVWDHRRAAKRICMQVAVVY